MSRRDRREAPRFESAPAPRAASPSVVAPPPAPVVPPPDASDVDDVRDPLPPPTAPVEGSSATLDAAPSPPASDDAPAASPAPRFVAVVRILAGRDGEFAPGDEIPAHVAADGLTEGVHWRREG